MRSGTQPVLGGAAGAGGEPFDGATVGARHVDAERAIESGGFAWTVLRPASFASNLLRHAPLIRAGEPLPNLAGDARRPVVDPRDVAAVAVAAPTGDAHDGHRYDLTGPELLTFADQAAILAGVLGRPVDATDVPTLDQVPPAMATGIGWARAGGAAYLTDHVPGILGRPAGTFKQWAPGHRTAFTNARG
ncbi:hypothetical protein ACIQK9_15660 [Streptomyces hydrogenans]|uniref:hypothetical protein n=1 Tax=Streptomyces hydrogenans TaxID=1873719 RepID=UPI00380D2E80